MAHRERGGGAAVGGHGPRASRACSSNVSRGSQRALAEQLVGRFRSLLPPFLEEQRWFAAKGETIEAVDIERLAVWEHAGGRWLLAWIEVTFASTLAAQRYFLPLAITWSEDEDTMSPAAKAASLARVRRHARMGMLHDAFTDPAFCRALAHAMIGGERVPLGDGALVFEASETLPVLLGLDASDDVAEACLALDVELAGTQGSNTAVVLSRRPSADDVPDGSDASDTGSVHRVFLKGYRRLQRGTGPELEIGRFLNADRCRGRGRRAPVSRRSRARWSSSTARRMAARAARSRCCRGT